MIRIRRDTAANWTSVNPVLGDGQPGYDITNNQFRFGNGVTAWNSLTPVGGGGGVTDGDKGDITVSGGGATWTIDAAAVTLSKIADLATSTILGRATAGTGSPEALTATQVRTILNVANGATANSADAVLLARANHTGTQLASTISDFATAVAATAAVTANTAKVTNATHTGDVTGATALTIANDVVTNTKLANMAANSIKGNNTGATADPLDLTAAQVRTLINVADGATANASDAALRDRATHTGTQGVATITGTKAQFDTAVTDGNIMFIGDPPTAHTHLLAAGATDVTITAANLNTLDDGADTTLHFHAADRARANHTGTQAAATITGLATIATSGSASDLGAGTLPAARFDDTAHGARAGGSLHANAVASGAAGFMTGADKTKLDGIASGAQVNVPTDLSYTASTRVLASSTGADATLPLATTTDAGLAPARSGVATQYLDGTGVYSTPAGGGGGAVTVQDEGSTITAALAVLNFTGAGVTVTGGTTAVVNIPGGGGGFSSPLIGWLV